MKKYFKHAACIIMSAIILAGFNSCKKENDAELPGISLKEGTGYTSSSGAVPKNSILKVGIVADKNKADLRRLDITVLVAHSNTEQTKKTIYMDASQASHFEYDYEPLKTGDASGTQTWKFKVADKDGNVGETSLYLTVQ